MPPFTFFICLLADSGDEPSLKDCASRPKAPGVAAEAAELQGIIFLLLVGVEEVQGDALEGDLGLWQVLNLKRAKLGYLWLARE